MAATFEDAILGYEYYLDKRGKASVDEINDYLYSRLRNPISKRTYTHYRKLLKAGFRSYIPINQFDVLRTLGRVYLSADRRRYARTNVEDEAKISLDQEKWQPVTIFNKSLVGLGLVTSSSFPLSKGTLFYANIKGYIPIPLIAVWVEVNEPIMRIGTRAPRFIAHYKIADTLVESRPMGTIVLSKVAEGEVSYANFVAVLNRSLEFISSVDDLIYTVNDIVKEDIQLEQPILESINFSSPGDAPIKIDLSVADVAAVIIDKVIFFGKERERRSLENKKLEIGLLRETIELANTIRSSSVTPEMRAELSRVVMEILDIEELPEGVDLFGTDSPELNILLNRTIPAFLDVSLGDDPTYTLGVISDDENAEEAEEDVDSSTE